MASMTDVIFLLLIFFMITSTVVSPNAIKVLLPQGKQQTSAKPLTRVIIDKDLNFYAAFGNEKEQPVALNDLTSFLQSCAEKEPEMYVALYADESVPYREIRSEEHTSELQSQPRISYAVFCLKKNVSEHEKGLFSCLGIYMPNFPKNLYFL